MEDKKKNDGADLHNLLSYRLSVVSNLLSRSQQKRFASVSDISLPEWRALVLVETYGPLSVKSLSRHAGLDFGQTSRLVSRMCEDGSIVKQATNDARSVNLVLTDRGKSLHRRLWKVAMQCNDDFLGSLGAQEQKVLAKALDTLAGKARAAIESAERETDATPRRA